MPKTGKYSSKRKRIPKMKSNPNQIAKSKRLLEKSKSKNNKSNVNLNNTNNKRKQKDLKCETRKRMPSLADLEKMFDDSDNGVILPSTSGINSTQARSNHTKTGISNDLLVPCIILTDIEHHNTPLRKNSCASDNNEVDGPTPPKKLKTDHNCNNAAHSGSESEIVDLPASPSSSDTIIYDAETLGRFSPLPSTSKDNARILENEKRLIAILNLNENLQCGSPTKSNEICSTTSNQVDSTDSNEDDSTKSNDGTQSDVELIETPVETIVINDDNQSSRHGRGPFQYLIVLGDDNTTELEQNEVIDINDSTIDNSEDLHSYEDLVTVNETSVIHEVPNVVDSNEVITVEDDLPSNIINDEDLTGNDEADVTYINTLLHEEGLNSGCRFSRVLLRRLMNTVAEILTENLDEPEICDIKHSVETHQPLTERNSSNHETKMKNSSENSVKPPGILKDCPICMDSLASKDVASTICGHIFCMDCMKVLASKRSNKKCPTCRKVLKGYHQIFL